MLSLKKKDLVLNFYSNLDPEIDKQAILERLVMISSIQQVYLICDKIAFAQKYDDFGQRAA